MKKAIAVFCIVFTCFTLAGCKDLKNSAKLAKNDTLAGTTSGAPTVDKSDQYYYNPDSMTPMN